MTYTVEIKPAAQRQIKKLTLSIQAQIIQELEELELDPRHPGVLKMSGEENTYRVRVGRSGKTHLNFLDKTPILCYG